MTNDEKVEYKKLIETLDKVQTVYGIYRNKQRSWYVSYKNNNGKNTTSTLRSLLLETGLELGHNLRSFVDKNCLVCGVTFTPKAGNQIYCNTICLNKSETKLNHSRKSVLKAYNLTLEDYDKMLLDQQGVCLICKTIPKRFVVDHDHQTGKVRGLLCVRCNSCLGWYEQFHIDAVNYLRCAPAEVF